MRIPLALAVFTLAAASALPALADSPSQPTLSLSGHGEISASPDVAILTTGVASQAPTARQALEANNADMAKLLAMLKAAGIDPKDIQTSGFSVNPQYVYPKADDGSNLPPHVEGYEVSNAVTVKIDKLPELGGILDKMVSSGANTINGISFSVDDPSKLYDEARKAAVADARHKADIYAAAAGVTLGDVISISDEEPVAPPPRPLVMAMAAPAAKAVPVEAGQVSYSADVSLVWALKPAP
jgi:uncharacterized protein YggE